MFLQSLRLIYPICLVSMHVTRRHLAFNMTKEFVCFSSVHYIIHQLPKLKISDLSWTFSLHSSVDSASQMPKYLHFISTMVIHAKSLQIRSDEIRSVTQSCLTLCDPMNRSTSGLPVHHQLPEFTETHVHRVSDAIQPSHPLSSPSPLAPNPSQHQSLFQ